VTEADAFKASIRLEALRLAIETAGTEVGSTQILRVAGAYEEFLLGKEERNG
jgi:hypothetical protein